MDKWPENWGSTDSTGEERKYVNNIKKYIIHKYIKMKREKKQKRKTKKMK